MKNIKTILHRLVLIGLTIYLSACATPSQFISEETRKTGRLSNDSVLLNASSPALTLQSGVLLTDNDDAFESKLALINEARHTIDLAYYIFADDYTSSTLSVALIEAAKRGVKVRMLLDYHSNYKNLDLFSMLESAALSASGSIEVRFYNRPTENQIKDAIFVTMGCGEAEAQFSGCSASKISEMDEEIVDAALQGNLMNLNKAGSGLFLSGLYAKNPSLMAVAIKNGYQLDIDTLSAPAGGDSEQLKSLKKLGQLYYQAQYGNGVDRILGKLKLRLAYALYGDQIRPIYDVFSSLLPVEQANRSDRALKEWRHFSDFLHHKLLLVDGHKVQLGGRNVEDSYHMNPNSLAAKYIFMDTDVVLQLDKSQENHLTTAYEKLWGFRDMVATIADIRQHAPNEALATMKYAAEKCNDVKPDGKTQHELCIEGAMQKLTQIPLADRVKDRSNLTDTHASEYRQQYKAKSVAARSKQFSIDDSAQVYYVENLPFNIAMPETSLERELGAINEYEGDSGKHIHATWLAALNNVCQQAIVAGKSGMSPKDIVLHNAYLFLPSNILAQLAKMSDGRVPCGNVNIAIVTNSIQTTDLNIVNILSRHSMKAFFDHINNNRDISSGANIKYYEYASGNADSKLSLHTKISVFGDDLFVGSANADVRSYMMDTNNGLFIRQAPNLVKDYVSWVKNLITTKQVVSVDQYFVTTERDQILKEDLLTVDATLAKYKAERWLKEDDKPELKQHIIDLLDQVYNLSIEIVSKKGGSSRAQAQYNSLFKTI
jgi:phosphatidylserine/phosphatidylglycerophosphate/cardiolipin synthase-like enzyme